MPVPAHSGGRRGLDHTMRTMALQALIDDTIGRNDWHDTDVARRANDRGYKLTRSDISYYRRHGMRTLVPAKVRALAIGLQLPTYRVAVAVLADLGIDVPLDVRTPEAAIEHDHTISALARRSMLTILREDRDAR